MDKKKLGHFGEKIATRFLEKRGYLILDKNWALRFQGPQLGELDLICQKNGQVIFVEVKTIIQKGSEFIPPETKVNWFKKQKLKRTALFWLNSKKISSESPLRFVRFDIISVILLPLQKKAKIFHFQDVF